MSQGTSEREAAGVLCT